MVELRRYRTPQEYLDASKVFLQQNEVLNNLPLGLCNNFKEKSQQQPGCHFLNCFRDGVLTSSSIKTLTNAIIAGSPAPEEIALLAHYYKEQDGNLQGVIGEASFATAFASAYHSGATQSRTMLIYELTEVQPGKSANGRFEPASLMDIDLLTDWYVAFNTDVQARPQQTREQLQVNLTGRIRDGNVYVWRSEGGDLVSIAAVVRKTDNAGIVGLVYTPPQKRGRGYASSVVRHLSQKLLQEGLTKCGLFTEQANPTSNWIYQQIGYVLIAEFGEIQFV